MTIPVNQKYLIIHRVLPFSILLNFKLIKRVIHRLVKKNRILINRIKYRKNKSMIFCKKKKKKDKIKLNC